MQDYTVTYVIYGDNFLTHETEDVIHASSADEALEIAESLENEQADNAREYYDAQEGGNPFTSVTASVSMIHDCNGMQVY